MSVLIKGMKIPNSCYDCDMLELSGVVGCKHAYDTKNSTWGRALNCPLIELPDHGDLIDREKLNATDSWEWIRYLSPVVIPAERKEQ